MGLYGSAIIKGKREFHNYSISETPSDVREREKQMTKENSVRYKRSSYGGNIKLKNYLNEKEKLKSIQESQPIIQKEDYHEVVDLSKQKYIERLAKLKESLVLEY